MKRRQRTLNIDEIVEDEALDDIDLLVDQGYQEKED